MTALRIFLARLRGLFAGDARVNEEIETHIEMLAAEYERRGLTREEARFAARREFGSATQVRETHRAQRRLPLVDSLVQDLRYTLRQWRAHPGFAATAIVTLALGIGANTAIFNLLNTVVLEPLPVPDPQQLVILQPIQDGRRNAFSYPQLREMAAQQHVVQSMFGASTFTVREATIDGRTPQTKLLGSLVTEQYFEGLGVRPFIGRLLTDADQDPAAEPAVAISFGLWRREFASQSSAIGKTIRINGLTATIAGVAPPEFFGDELGKAPDFWLPLHQSKSVYFDLTQPGIAFLRPMARLRPDVPVERAEAALDGLYYQVRDLGTHLIGTKNFDLELLPGSQGLGSLHTEFGRPLWLLMGIVGLIALIASCNLANLLLARATARSHEIGVRLALGAGRARLIRQLLTESALLAALGGMAGFAMAWWGSRALVMLALAEETTQLSVDAGWRVVAFAALVALVTVFAFGLAPALAATRVPVNTALQANRRALTGAASRRTSAAFVVAQVALSMLLLAGASLLVRSFWQLTHQDFGYRTDGVLTANLAFEGPSFAALRGDPAFTDHLRGAAAALPGVRSAAVQMGGPLAGVSEDGYLALPDRQPGQNDPVNEILVSSHYFETMGIPVTRGRPIAEEDRKGAPQVAVVSETLARRFFGSADPVGRRFSLGKKDERFHPDAAIQIVGVAKDVRYRNPREAFEPVLFLPLSQSGYFTTPEVVVYTTGNPAQLVEPLKRMLAELSPGATFDRTRTLSDAVLRLVRRDRLLAWLSGAFGALALVLAAVGLYGVIACAAALRTREIGIRLALGARPGQVRGLLLREVIRLLAIGLPAGGAAALLLARSLDSLLFGLTPRDPATFAAAAVLLAAVAAAAGYLPARRASKLDPMSALRQE